MSRRADDNLRDRIARALTQDAALGGCDDIYFCMTHRALRGPDDTHCTRIAGLTDALLPFVRAEVADTLDRITDRWQWKDWADIPKAGDSLQRYIGTGQYVTNWLRGQAEVVRNG